MERNLKGGRSRKQMQAKWRTTTLVTKITITKPTKNQLLDVLFSE